MNWLLVALLAQWLQVFDTSAFWPPFSDPSGITFANGNLLVVDSEVGETTMFDRDTLFEMTTEGVVRSSVSLQWLTKEPTGIAYDSSTRTLFISEDNRGGMLHTLKAGPDLLLGTDDDVSTSVRMRDIGIVGVPTKDIEGVAFHGGTVYLAGGSSAMVYAIQPGKGGFDKTASLVKSFSVSPMTSVEGITIVDSILYAVGIKSFIIYSFDLSGSYLGQQVLPWVRGISGIAMDETTGIFYVTHRGLDNNKYPNENDGKIHSVKSEFTKE